MADSVAEDCAEAGGHDMAAEKNRMRKPKLAPTIWRSGDTDASAAFYAGRPEKIPAPAKCKRGLAKDSAERLYCLGGAGAACWLFIDAAVHGGTMPLTRA